MWKERGKPVRHVALLHVRDARYLAIRLLYGLKLMAKRRDDEPREERGVYVNRVRGTVRAVASDGRDLSVRFAYNGDLEAVIADAFTELDARDPIQHDGPLPPPRYLRLLM